MTALLILIPLIAALFVRMASPAQSKLIAFAASFVQLALTVFILLSFHINADPQFTLNLPWIKSLGINFHIALDGLSLLLVLLTNVLVPLILLSSFSNTQLQHPKSFYALILIMQAALVGVFSAQDGFLFYVFWELALIPIWFICLLWGNSEKIKQITFKFFVYTLAGSLLMLVAFIYVYLQTNTLIQNDGTLAARSFDVQMLYEAGANMSHMEQTWVFWAIFIAFAIKMPVFPFHTWQPDTYVTAPSQGTMLLSGIMLKMGTYGLLRWLLPVVPLGTLEWSWLAILLSVIGILYASVIAIMQKDLKRLIAYSSIAHVGLISAGIFALNIQGFQGGVMQMLAHGINVVGLFFVTDILMRRTKTNTISELGGIRNVAPFFATAYMIIMLASVALPITNGFVGEFLLLNGLYRYDAWTTAFAGLSVILGAVYMLRSYQGTMLGEANERTSTFEDLSGNEKAVMITIIVLIFVMGVYPKPLLDIAEPSLMNLLNWIQFK